MTSRFLKRLGRDIPDHCTPTRHEGQGEEEYLGETENPLFRVSTCFSISAVEDNTLMLV